MKVYGYMVWVDLDKQEQSRMVSSREFSWIVNSPSCEYACRAKIAGDNKRRSDATSSYYRLLLPGFDINKHKTRV